MPHYTFYLASRKFADTYPETAKQVVDELGKLSAWANSHQDEAAGLLSTSTGLDKAELQAALKPLARRLDAHPPVIKRSDISSALAHLVSGQVPTAFKAAPMPLALNSLCTTRDLLALNTERSQWYAGSQFNVAVVVLRNQFNRNVRIDEKECSNAQTLAVSVWPRAWLKPGEEAEVFIAMRPVVKAEHIDVTRPSLITPTQRTAP